MYIFCGIDQDYKKMNSIECLDAEALLKTDKPSHIIWTELMLNNANIINLSVRTNTIVAPFS